MIQSRLRAARIYGCGVSRSVAALLFLGLCIPGTARGAGDVVSNDDPKHLMNAVMRAASNGDFQSAWTGYQHAYALMRDSPAIIEKVSRYCRHAGCPFIGNIAWILGKRKSDLTFLDEVCRDATDACARLLADAGLAKAYLNDTAASPPFPHDAEIRFVHTDKGDVRAWTLVDIGQKARWALINSGDHMVEFSMRSPVITKADYETYGDPITRGANFANTGIVYRRAVLRTFTLGAATEDRIPAAARDEAMGYVSLGMSALLRYSQVCVSQFNATLHLGDLGPCDGGEQPFAATLTAKEGQPVLEILGGDVGPLRALVHTGATKTYCRDRLAGGGTFRFGNHPGLEARCSRESVSPQSDGPWDAEIGMDTLMKFSAFGWELDPFRMYFVPKETRYGSQTASPSSGAQEGVRQSYTEELLDETVHAASQGDFEAVWAGYHRLHKLLRTSKRSITTHQNYCNRSEGCPDIGVVAWILGKAKHELSFLDGRCHDVTDHACVRWLERVRLLKAFLDEKPEIAMHPPNHVEMEFIHADLDDLRPWTIIHVGGKPMWGMMDTGGVFTLFPAGSSILTHADYQTYGEPQAVKEADGIIRERQDAVLHDFRLGLVAEDHVPSKRGDPTGDAVTIGMSVLLRYPQVCFSWPDATLHLGSLGPCALGEAPFAAALSPKGQPFVDVDMGDGQPLRALIDTGAPKTDCQNEFMQRMGTGAFRFGPHPDLVARCGEASPSLHLADWVDAVIGMDTLWNFQAVGWELNPFRMYFVPKNAGGDSRASEPVKTPTNAEST